MKASPVQKILLVMFLGTAVLVLLLQLLAPKTRPETKAEPPKTVLADPGHHFVPPQIPVRSQTVSTNSGLEDDNPSQKISREKVEAWLAKHHRNAMSLLAAFRALDDTNYLNEAATNFPGDPHVELSVLAKNEFPDDRRKWLDLFKNSSPSNSLANYLSAQDYFTNGRTNEAVQEILAVSGKKEFDMFTTENRIDAEDLYSSSGIPAVETATDAMSDMAGENLNELATFKRLTQGIGELEQQYLAGGDSPSAENLAQAGLAFANQMQTGDSGKYLINQLVGTAETSIVLSKLDQNTSYDFLNGETPAQVREEMKTAKQANVQLMTQFQAAYLQMTPDEMASYSERSKIYGELPAMQWVVQQHPPAQPQQ
jgi:hypothetical protein